MERQLNRIQIAVPYADLVELYLDLILKNHVHPEIGLSAQALDRFTLEDFAGVARKLEDTGLHTTIHAPFTDLCPASEDPLIRDASRRRIFQVLELIEVFRPRSIVAHLGFEPRLHLEEMEAWVERWTGFWEECSPILATYGVPLMIENVFEWDPEVFERIFAVLPSPLLKFCFDTGHCLAFSHASWEEWVGRLHTRLGQLHIHDNLGGFDEHRAVGEGSFPFHAFFQDLAQRGLRPIVTLEAHKEEWVWTSLRNLAVIWPWEEV
ncbi:MAG: sugar phosphate isomerase/epimerase [Deltaproteobacteria bacterium]|nr:sugar phosphate isomerase/epimerase [Deltaproteobacteria bacterium]